MVEATSLGYLYTPGIIVTMAGGNNGSQECTYPAPLWETLGVKSIDHQTSLIDPMPEIEGGLSQILSLLSQIPTSDLTRDPTYNRFTEGLRREDPEAYWAFDSKGNLIDLNKPLTEDNK